MQELGPTPGPGVSEARPDALEASEARWDASRGGAEGTGPEDGDQSLTVGLLEATVRRLEAESRSVTLAGEWPQAEPGECELGRCTLEGKLEEQRQEGAASAAELREAQARRLEYEERFREMSASLAEVQEALERTQGELHACTAADGRLRPERDHDCEERQLRSRELREELRLARDELCEARAAPAGKDQRGAEELREARAAEDALRAELHQARGELSAAVAEASVADGQPSARAVEEQLRKQLRIAMDSQGALLQELRRATGRREANAQDVRLASRACGAQGELEEQLRIVTATEDARLPELGKPEVPGEAGANGGQQPLPEAFGEQSELEERLHAVTTSATELREAFHRTGCEPVGARSDPPAASLAVELREARAALLRAEGALRESESGAEERLEEEASCRSAAAARASLRELEDRPRHREVTVTAARRDAPATREEPDLAAPGAELREGHEARAGDAATLESALQQLREHGEHARHLSRALGSIRGTNRELRRSLGRVDASRPEPGDGEARARARELSGRPRAEHRSLLESVRATHRQLEEQLRGLAARGTPGAPDRQRAAPCRPSSPAQSELEERLRQATASGAELREASAPERNDPCPATASCPSPFGERVPAHPEASDQEGELSARRAAREGAWGATLGLESSPAHEQAQARARAGPRWGCGGAEGAVLVECQGPALVQRGRRTLASGER